MDGLIKKIFRSYDFKNNRILNAKVETPEHEKHIANKKFVDDALTYDTEKAILYKNPFKQWWMVNVQNKSLKVLLDDLLFPRIVPTYENPTLAFNYTLIDNSYFFPIAGINRTKYVVNIGLEVTGKFHYHLIINDREPNLNPARLIIQYPDETSQTFNSVNNNTSGFVEFTYKVTPGTVFIFEKGFLAAEPKQDTYGENSVPAEFADTYRVNVDVTNDINSTMVYFDSMFISAIRMEEGIPEYLPEDVPLQFSMDNKLNFSADSEGIFDILIPKSIRDKSAIYDFPIVAKLFQVTNGGVNNIFLTEVKLEWEWLTHYTNGDIIEFAGTEYVKCQFNFGIYPFNVRVELDFSQINNSTYLSEISN